MRNEAAQIKRLRSMIRREVLPDFEQIDWSDVYYYWTQRNGKPKKKYPRKSLTTEEYYHIRARSMNRRALAKGQPNEISGEDLLRIMDESKSKCKKCGGGDSLVFDHIIPYYRGGKNEAKNLQVLCRQCNMEKGVG